MVQFIHERYQKRTRNTQTVELVTEGLVAISYRFGLQRKFKVQCLQFMVIPELLWPLLVYEICSTIVEAIEANVNKFIERQLGGASRSQRCNNVLL